MSVVGLGEITEDVQRAIRGNVDQRQKKKHVSIESLCARVLPL